MKLKSISPMARGKVRGLKMPDSEVTTGSLTALKFGC